jgi:hypothetical protein
VPLTYADDESVDAQRLQEAALAYLAENDSDEPDFQSLTTIYEKLPARLALLTSVPEYERGLEDKEKLHVALNRLVSNGLAERRWVEERYDPSYRLTQDGYYQASIGATALVADPTQETSSGIDPVAWTGTQLTHVDSGVLAHIRMQCGELRTLVYEMNYRSAEDQRDLQRLADALVALCDMAQPDISLIVRLLAHPKFKIYATLFAAAATIRGALGI